MRKREALRVITEQGDYRMIPNLFDFFLKVPGNWVMEAIQPMKILLAKAPYEQPQLLYRQFRYLHFDLWHLDDFMRFPEDEAICLLSLASMNSNGFVREKALRYLSNFQKPQIIPFVMFRLVDWVPDVSSVAHRILPQYLQAKFAPDFIKHYRLMDWLLIDRRDDLKPVVNSILETLTSQEAQSVLISAFHNPDSNAKKRLFLIKTLLKADPIEAIRLASRTNEFLLKLAVIPSVTKLDYANSIMFLDRFLRDQSGPVRLKALQFIPENEYGRFEPTILDLLHDRMSSVRSLARILLKKKEIKDFPALYRNTIKENQTQPGTLMGLAETGGREDAELIRPFLENKDMKVVSAAIRALEQLRDEKLVEQINVYLFFPNRKVRKAAQRVLKENIDREKIAELRVKLVNGNYLERRSVFQILLQNAGWGSVIDILHVILYGEEDLTILAFNYIPVWLKRAGKIFLKPHIEDQNQAKDLLFAIKIAGIPIPKPVEFYWRKLEEIVG